MRYPALLIAVLGLSLQCKPPPKGENTRGGKKSAAATASKSKGEKAGALKAKDPTDKTAKTGDKKLAPDGKDKAAKDDKGTASGAASKKGYGNDAYGAVAKNDTYGTTKKASKKSSYVLHAGTLINGRNGIIRKEVSVKVEKGVIKSITPGYIPAPAGVTEIDLRRHTVMPGLIDTHVNLANEPGKNRYHEDHYMTASDYALRAVQAAERTLMAGFTTVRDMGHPHNVTIHLRDAIKKGWVKGPRVYTAGKSISTTGGHSVGHGYVTELMEDPGPEEGVVNSPDDARKAVRQRHREGADLLVLSGTGDVLTRGQAYFHAQFTDEELETVMKTARDYDMRVAVQAHGKEGMKRAIRARVASIEHGTYLDDDLARGMLDNKIYYVATLSAGKWFTKKAQIPGYFSEIVAAKAAGVGPKIKKSFTIAFRSGVKIAFGSGAGVIPHGKNAQEFLNMLETGMHPMAAIRTATYDAAKLLGMSKKLGAIEPKRKADIIAVPGDPLEDASLLQQVAFVMKDGVIYKQPEPRGTALSQAPTPTPSAAPSAAVPTPASSIKP